MTPPRRDSLLAEASVELAVGGGTLYDARRPRCWRSLRGHRDLNVLRHGLLVKKISEAGSGGDPSVVTTCT